MKMKGLVLTAALLQFTLVGAFASSRQPVQTRAESGQGWGDALTCAGCIAGGIILIGTVGAEAAALVIVNGGAAAVTAATAIAACATACYNALT
jgi:hypothetical protein